MRDCFLILDSLSPIRLRVSKFRKHRLGAKSFHPAYATMDFFLRNSGSDIMLSQKSLLSQNKCKKVVLKCWQILFNKFIGKFLVGHRVAPKCRYFQSEELKSKRALPVSFLLANCCHAIIIILPLNALIFPSYFQDFIFWGRKCAKLESTNVFGLIAASTSSASSSGTTSNMNTMLTGAGGLASASAVAASTLDSATLYQAQACSIAQVSGLILFYV